MAYNQSSKQLDTIDKKHTFKNYMNIQVRYIRLISYILNIDALNAIEKFALRYKELYTKKHEVYINN